MLPLVGQLICLIVAAGSEQVIKTWLIAAPPVAVVLFAVLFIMCTSVKTRCALISNQTRACVLFLGAATFAIGVATAATMTNGIRSGGTVIGCVFLEGVVLYNALGEWAGVKGLLGATEEKVRQVEDEAPASVHAAAKAVRTVASALGQNVSHEARLLSQCHPFASPSLTADIWNGTIGVAAQINGDTLSTPAVSLRIALCSTEGARKSGLVSALTFL